jgi:hypothetical protein
MTFRSLCCWSLSLETLRGRSSTKPLTKLRKLGIMSLKSSVMKTLLTDSLMFSATCPYLFRRLAVGNKEELPKGQRTLGDEVGLSRGATLVVLSLLNLIRLPGPDGLRLITKPIRASSLPLPCLLQLHPNHPLPSVQVLHQQLLPHPPQLALLQSWCLIPTTRCRS